MPWKMTWVLWCRYQTFVVLKILVLHFRKYLGSLWHTVFTKHFVCWSGVLLPLPLRFECSGCRSHWEWPCVVEDSSKATSVFWTACCVLKLFFSLKFCCFCIRLDHIVYDQAVRIHPLWIACYADEDLVGKIKTMAVESNPRQMARQVLKRYMAYTCCRWQRQLQVWCDVNLGSLYKKRMCISPCMLHTQPRPDQSLSPPTQRKGCQCPAVWDWRWLERNWLLLMITYQKYMEPTQVKFA